MGTFEVHAGDFRKGRGRIHSRAIELPPPWGLGFGERVPFSAIEEIAVSSEENVKRLGGTVGWGITGAVLLGPVGLLAGLLAGGRGKNVTFVCRLKDGRKFLATTDAKMFTKRACHVRGLPDDSLHRSR